MAEVPAEHWARGALARLAPARAARAAAAVRSLLLPPPLHLALLWRPGQTARRTRRGRPLPRPTAPRLRTPPTRRGGRCPGILQPTPRGRKPHGRRGPADPSARAQRPGLWRPQRQGPHFRALLVVGGAYLCVFTVTSPPPGQSCCPVHPPGRPLSPPPTCRAPRGPFQPSPSATTSPQRV